MILRALQKIQRNLNKIIKNKMCCDFFFSTRSYSQEGEDLILNRFFEGKKDGFYVDVGAHHPKRFSNTYFFYRRGWRGINVDAMPGSMALFNKHRPRDINIEIPVAEQKQIMTYYTFNEPALNGFSKELSQKRDGCGEYFITSALELETVTLQEILNTHLPLGVGIDFLTIDVEGLDYAVIKSVDFKKYRPKFILIEILDFDITKLKENTLCSYLAEQGFAFFAKAINTVFFIDEQRTHHDY